MSVESHTCTNVLGHRIRSRREVLGWSQEKLGVEIGLEESSSRARISRYELGTHEPPVKVSRRIAEALGVPLPYLYCEDDQLALLVKLIAQLPRNDQSTLAHDLVERMGQT